MTSLASFAAFALLAAHAIALGFVAGAALSSKAPWSFLPMPLAAYFVLAYYAPGAPWSVPTLTLAGICFLGALAPPPEGTSLRRDVLASGVLVSLGAVLLGLAAAQGGLL